MHTLVKKKLFLIHLLLFVSFSVSAEKLQEIKLSCENGKSIACFNLGAIFRTGKGIKIDKKEALKWYKKAAEQGMTISQRNLGHMYANGEGVKVDKKEALKWYRKAAKQGDIIAQELLIQIEKL